MATPTIKPELRELILKALKLNYLSVSCKDAVQTGNAYQSLSLGDTSTAGFRTSRMEVLDQIDFGGKTVLDLGSNLGEISRSVRERGATLVDGFEYDSYFVEIANLANAFNDVTRVSFYQRDVTDPAIYKEHYDIVLAFSVFHYASTVLTQLAEITDELFVLETHKLEDNLESGYINPVKRYFPFYKILGTTEWGASMDASEKRAVIVFARKESVLAAALLPQKKKD